MAVRDPETGQFVSGASQRDIDWRDVVKLQGYMSSEIPAADLSGQTIVQVDGQSNVVLVDFDQVLAANEVLEIIAIRSTVVLALHTTASAEGYAQLSYEMSFDISSTEALRDADAFFEDTEESNDVADMNLEQSDSDNVLWSGFLAAENSFGDSTNGLGAGPDIDRDRMYVPYHSIYGTGPLVDADDELAAPHEYEISNVSDHAVLGNFTVDVHGIIHDV